MQRIFLLFVLFLMANQVFAVRVNSIYTVTVPVTSQTADEREKAIGQGLGKVLIKVTGNPDIMDNPSLKFQVSNAKRLVQEYSYTTGSRSQLLKLKFDEEGVNQIIHDADVPVWSANRPLILAWIAFQVPGKQPEIIDNGSMSDIKSSLKHFSEQRGVPVIFPVMDMDDLNKISVNDVVNMNKDGLKNAAKRYESEAILIARIFPQMSGFSAQAKLLLGTDEWSWTLTDNSAEEVLGKLIDNVADTMVHRFATLNKNLVKGQTMLKVTGIAQHSDYEMLLKYLNQLTPVAGVELVRIVGNTVTLTVNLRGPEQSFIQALEVGEKLVPVQASDSNLKVLTYEWKH